MNELIMPHNAGVKRVLESMKEVLALYKNVTGNYRPLLDGEHLTVFHLTLVHIEQNVECTSHVSYSVFNFGCKTTISFGVHRYAKYSSLRNKGGTTRLSISGRVPTGGDRCCVLPRFAW